MQNTLDLTGEIDSLRRQLKHKEELWEVCAGLFRSVIFMLKKRIDKLETENAALNAQLSVWLSIDEHREEAS